MTQDTDRYQVLQSADGDHYAVVDLKAQAAVKTFIRHDQAAIYADGANRVQRRLDQAYGRWVRAAV